jgi:hypothetical protein
MIQKASGNEALGHTQVKERFRQFKKAQTLVESDECSSRNQQMIVKVHLAVLDHQRITIRELSNELGLSFALAQSILAEDLGKKCALMKSVPKPQTVQQKEPCLAVVRGFL